MAAGGGGGERGAQVGRATSSITAIGGGDRPKARSGPGDFPHRRRNTDRVRPLQGVVLPAVQPGTAQ